MNNYSQFSNGDYVKCKTWGGIEILGLFEYYYMNGSQCVVDAKSGIHYNIRPNDIQYASADETDLIRILVNKNDIVAKEAPSYLKLLKNRKEKQESDLELILKPISSL